MWIEYKFELVVHFYMPKSQCISIEIFHLNSKPQCAYVLNCSDYSISGDSHALGILTKYGTVLHLFQLLSSFLCPMCPSVCTTAWAS